ncbi:MAG: hypothetical protein WAU23_01180 [Ferruginibacter sp.]
MKRLFIISLLIPLIFVQSASAQSTDSLNQLKDHDFPVYYSSGHKKRAEVTALRIEKAMAYHRQMLGFKPNVILFVLNETDWKVYTSGMVYGMPHYDDKNNRLIIAAEDNPFWKSFLPPPNQLPNELREPIQTAYTNGEGQLSMQAFFDLLAIHELGHAFHIQNELTMQRMWMGELFCNILLHTYIAENEPELLPALTLFPRMVVAGGAREFKYTKLQDVHERYNEIGQQHPKNYGWYQCRWHTAAAGIYDSVGKEVCKKLWDALKTQKEILNDEQLPGFLEKAVDKSIADMIRHWDSDTVR